MNLQSNMTEKVTTNYHMTSEFIWKSVVHRSYTPSCVCIMLGSVLPIYVCVSTLLWVIAYLSLTCLHMYKICCMVLTDALWKLGSENPISIIHSHTKLKKEMHGG